MIPNLLWAACVVATALALPSEWNQTKRDDIVEAHNKIRRNEGGCQINKLEYDMDLERQARGWAERCKFKHENIAGRGENLAWNSNHKPEQTMIDKAMTGFFDEKKIYSYGQQSCARSCHYTQLVWDKTSKVGCWTTRCPYLYLAYNDAWFLVCFYKEGGNIYGEKPYKKSCDTPCRPGQTIENGLCVGEWVDEKKVAEEACDDKKPECSYWAKDNQCVENKTYMMKNCKLSCTDCGGPKPSATCVDESSDCAKWAKRGECGRNRAYMMKKCKLSCNNCGGPKPTAACVDNDKRCTKWANRGECDKNKSYMHKSCRKSCGLC